MAIKKPNPGQSSIDRLLDCEEAMEDAYDGAADKLVTEAIVAGWTEEEAEEAIFGLAQSRVWERQARDAKVVNGDSNGSDG